MRNAKHIEEERVRFETTRVERIKEAVRLEIRACTDRAAEVVERVRKQADSAPTSLRLVKGSK